MTGLASRLSTWVEDRAERERDQLPLWLPVGLLLGIAAWGWLSGPGAWIAFIAVMAASCLALAAFGGGRRWTRALAWFGLAGAFGCALIWLRAESVAEPRLAWPRMAAFSAEIEAVEQLPARGLVRLMLRPDEAAGLPPRVRVNIPADRAPDGLAPGAGVALRAWLMPPAPQAVPGGYDFARTAWFAGIGATGRVVGEVTVARPAPETGWRGALADWRQRLANHVRAQMAGGAGGIAATLATGDRGGIPEEDAEAMRRSGLAHLLSISGLHVTAVVGAAMLLTLRLLALSPALALRWNLILVAAGVGALAGLLYTLLTGAQVPTVRACVAAMLVLVGIALGRDAITLRLVATGAVFVCLLWPETAAGPSFQMSFAAVTAIIALHEHPRVRALLSRREEGRGRRFGRILLGLFLTGLAVEIALTPIALFHFHKSGIYGAFANLIAIPLTTFVIMPVQALALLFDFVGLGAPFWWAAEVSLNLLLRVAHTTSSAPGAVALLPTMPAGAFGLMVLGGLWLALWRTDWRALGVAPVAAGALWALMTPPPDLLVTGDGRHVLFRTEQGELALLRGRAGDYVRSMLAETSGAPPDFRDLESLPNAACSPDLCAVDLVRGGRKWRILATRSDYWVDYGPLARACAEADIVISDRRLPRTCTPRWLKADRTLLRQTGGLAVRLTGTGKVTTTADSSGGKPWQW